MKYFEMFLLFVTLWIALIGGLVYLTHRRKPSFGPGSQACCLAVPCSAACAREHQHLRDQGRIQYDRIVHELGQIVQAGHELEAPEHTLVGPPEQPWQDDQQS